jgi:hypothetical protein
VGLVLVSLTLSGCVARAIPAAVRGAASAETKMIMRVAPAQAAATEAKAATQVPKAAAKPAEQHWGTEAAQKGLEHGANWLPKEDEKKRR